MQIIDDTKQEYQLIKVENNKVQLINDTSSKSIAFDRHSEDNYYYFTQLQEKHFLNTSHHVFFYVILGSEHFRIRADLSEYFAIKQLLSLMHLKDSQEVMRQLSANQIAEMRIKKIKKDTFSLTEAGVVFTYLNQEEKHFYYHELPMMDCIIKQIRQDYQGARLIFESQMTNKFFLLFGVYLFLLGTLQNTRLFYIFLASVNLGLFLIGVLIVCRSVKRLNAYRYIFSQTSDECVFKRQWYKKILLANIVCSFLLVVLKCLL